MNPIYTQFYMNLVIIVSLFSIGLALFIGYAWGNRNGIREERRQQVKKPYPRPERKLKIVTASPQSGGWFSPKVLGKEEAA